MLILIQKDEKNRVVREVTSQQRADLMTRFAIYDVNADGSKTGPFGPTAPAVQPPRATNLLTNPAVDGTRKVIDAVTGAVRTVAEGVTAAVLGLLVSYGGDSFTAHNHQAFIPTAQNALGGVITLTLPSHGLMTGEIVNCTGAAIEAANVVRATMTRIDANTVSFPAPGVADGAIASGPATYQMTAWSQQTAEGIHTHFNRLMGGVATMVAQAGCSGYQMAAYAARYATALQPFTSWLHVHWGYFNDCQFGVSVASSTASVQDTLLKRKAQGSLCAVVSPIAIPAGVYSWPVSGGMTDASAAAWIVQWARVMRDFCVANGMLWIDLLTPSTDPTTGYALAGWNKLGDIHPAQKANYFAGKLLKSALAPYAFVAKLLTSSVLDNVAGNASNRNIARAAPFVQGAGGGGSATVSYTPWATGQVVAALRWRTNAGHLYFTVAGGTTGATAPTHTANNGASGTNIQTDGAVQWIYMGEAVGVAGIPASWGVFATGSAACLAALVDDGNGGKLLRSFCYGGASGDQIRLSYNGLTTDVAPGDTVSAAAVLNLSTQMNPSIASVSNTPIAQNVKLTTAQIVTQSDAVSGVAFTTYEARNGVGVAAEQQSEDIVGAVTTVANALIPQGTVSLLRWDELLQFIGVGVCSVDVGRLTMTH